MAAGAITGAHRSDPSRSVAETPALEAPLCADRHDRAAGAGVACRRRIPFRHRYRGLCVVDVAAPVAIERFRMDRAMRRRLAQALARFHPDALSRQGCARAARVMFSGFQKNLKRAAMRTGALARTAPPAAPWAPTNARNSQTRHPAPAGTAFCRRLAAR